MTAPHVIEKLKKENNWFIVAKNEHEIALIHNCFLDMGSINKHRLTSSELGLALIKGDPWIFTCGYSDIWIDVSKTAHNLTDWFFKEVNNY